MAYRCLFMDNGIYTAQDVNDALSNLVSEGVSGYPFGNDAVAGLNEAIENIADGGTQYMGTSCLLVKSGGEYKISEGAAILEDGSQIIFDSDGYVIEHQSGVYEYVYLERDVLHNTVNVVVSTESGGADTIPIAEIKTDGTVLDRRRFSKAKVSLLAEPKNIGIVKRIVHATLASGESFDVELGFDGWKYVIYSFGTKYKSIKIENGDTISGIFPRNNMETGYYNAARTAVTRYGSTLHFENIGANWGDDFDVEIEVR